MPKPIVIMLTVAAFVVPVAAVVILNFEDVRELNTPQPNRGYVLYFHSPGCGACRHMVPTVNTLRRDGYDIRSVNVQSYPKMAGKYRIRAVPTFVMVSNGEEVRRRTGAMPAFQLRAMWRGSLF